VGVPELPLPGWSSNSAAGTGDAVTPAAAGSGAHGLVSVGMLPAATGSHTTTLPAERAPRAAMLHSDSDSSDSSNSSNSSTTRRGWG